MKKKTLLFTGLISLISITSCTGEFRNESMASDSNTDSFYPIRRDGGTINSIVDANTPKMEKETSLPSVRHDAMVRSPEGSPEASVKPNPQDAGREAEATVETCQWCHNVHTETVCCTSPTSNVCWRVTDVKCEGYF